MNEECLNNSTIRKLRFYADRPIIQTMPIPNWKFKGLKRTTNNLQQWLEFFLILCFRQSREFWSIEFIDQRYTAIRYIASGKLTIGSPFGSMTNDFVGTWFGCDLVMGR